jgi:hypothetical protein
MTGSHDTERTQATPPPAPPVSHWQMPSPDRPEFPGLPTLRERLVALVAALVVQATIAALDVLPHLPGDQWAGFWARFALIEFLAAMVISIAFGPGVGLRDLPAIGRVVLAVGFVVVPAGAVVLGGWDEVQYAATYGATAAAASELGIAFFATIFFGLPIIALAGPVRRAEHAVAPHGPTGSSA